PHTVSANLTTPSPCSRNNSPVPPARIDGDHKYRKGGVTMTERALRGMRIGANSMETEEGVEFAPRVAAIYDCPDGRVIIIPFSADAESPPVWEAPGGG